MGDGGIRNIGKLLHIDRQILCLFAGSLAGIEGFGVFLKTDTIYAFGSAAKASFCGARIPITLSLNRHRAYEEVSIEIDEVSISYAG